MSFGLCLFYCRKIAQRPAPFLAASAIGRTDFMDMGHERSGLSITRTCTLTMVSCRGVSFGGLPGTAMPHVRLLVLVHLVGIR
jgi:hypothetical protein